MKFSDSMLILIGNVVAGLMSLFAVIITARYVGPDIFGLCSILIILLTLCMGFADFGACAWAAPARIKETAAAIAVPTGKRYVFNMRPPQG